MTGYYERHGWDREIVHLSEKSEREQCAICAWLSGLPPQVQLATLTVDDLPDEVTYMEIFCVVDEIGKDDLTVQEFLKDHKCNMLPLATPYGVLEAAAAQAI